MHKLTKKKSSSRKNYLILKKGSDGVLKSICSILSFVSCAYVVNLLLSFGMYMIDFDSSLG